MSTNTCVICNGPSFSNNGHSGNLMPLCVEHEMAWFDSPERNVMIRARAAFIERTKAGAEFTGHLVERVVEKPKGLTIADAQNATGKWADQVFPDRTVHTSLAKLFLEEVPEFLTSKANDPGEYADLLILILDVAHQKRIDAESAFIAKHKTNMQRAWIKTPSGVYHNAGVGMGEEK